MQVTPEWIRMMARYNAWQNGWMVEAAGSLTQAERDLDRGAFFGSVSRTLSHVLWGDLIWLSRFENRVVTLDSKEAGGPDLFPDWDEYRAARATTDSTLENWAKALAPSDCEGDLSWYSGAMGQDMSRPRAVIFTNLFSHQTHHRGQVHGMLTAAGVPTDATDLVLMPESAWT